MTTASSAFLTIESADQGTPFVEAYGLLLASILLGQNGKPPGVVAVTSAKAGDGTTTTALNLALMMARTGRPTLLVDANMRAPALHQALGVAQTPGLADILTGRIEMKAAIISTRVPHLAVLPAGRAEMPAQALLSQTGLHDLFGLMRGRYDLVVVDTAPLLPYSDTLHIGKAVDGVLHVIAAEGASRRDQHESRQLLERVGARMLGTVLNRVPARAKGFRRG